MTTLRPVPRGTDGAISVVGTLTGALAVTIVAVAGVTVGLASRGALPLLVAAGVAGGLVDSLLGALAERRGLIGNEAVNAVATTAAGWIVIAVY